MPHIDDTTMGVYVDDIRQFGLDEANKRNPDVYRHLKRCRECRLVQRGALKILKAQADGRLPKWPEATKPDAEK
jgi:hypothetical protein